jgi:hypothetical protein
LIERIASFIDEKLAVQVMQAEWSSNYTYIVDEDAASVAKA